MKHLLIIKFDIIFEYDWYLKDIAASSKDFIVSNLLQYEPKDEYGKEVIRNLLLKIAGNEVENPDLVKKNYWIYNGV